MRDFIAEALTWPDNRHYLTGIKTARAWGVPPLAILTGSDDGWSPTNRILAQALTVVEDETCKNCSTPLWWAYSTDNRVQFSVEKAMCYGCAKLEDEKTGTSKDGKPKEKAKPGELLYVKPYNVLDGQPLPSRYDSYIREAERS